MILKNGRSRILLNVSLIAIMCSVYQVAAAQYGDSSTQPVSQQPAGSATSTVTATSTPKDYPNQEEVTTATNFIQSIGECNQLGDKTILFKPDPQTEFRIQSSKTAFCKMISKQLRTNSDVQVTTCEYSQPEITSAFQTHAADIQKQMQKQDKLPTTAGPDVSVLFRSLFDCKKPSPSQNPPAPASGTQIYDYSKMIH